MRADRRRIGWLGPLGTGRAKCRCQCHDWLYGTLATWRVIAAWKEQASSEEENTVYYCDPCYELTNEAEGVGFFEYVFEDVLPI